MLPPRVMNNLPSSIYRRKAAELRSRRLMALLQLVGQPAAFAALMRQDYGVTDPAVVEALRQRARQGDVDWYPRLRFATDTQLGSQPTRVVEQVVMLSDAYVHANDEAARLFCRAARACMGAGRTSPRAGLKNAVRRAWHQVRNIT